MIHKYSQSVSQSVSQSHLSYNTSSNVLVSKINLNKKMSVSQILLKCSNVLRVEVFVGGDHIQDASDVLPS